MAAPHGNSNAAKAKKWSAAIERALARAAGEKDPYQGIEPTPTMRAMDELADVFVAQCKGGDLGFFREFGDRIEGKPKQQVELSGDSDAPLETKITVEVVRAGADPSSA